MAYLLPKIKLQRGKGINSFGPLEKHLECAKSKDSRKGFSSMFMELGVLSAYRNHKDSGWETDIQIKNKKTRCEELCPKCRASLRLSCVSGDSNLGFLKLHNQALPESLLGNS